MILFTWGLYRHTPITCDVDFIVVGVLGERGPCDEEGDVGTQFTSSSTTCGCGPTVAVNVRKKEGGRKEGGKEEGGKEEGGKEEGGKEEGGKEEGREGGGREGGGRIGGGREGLIVGCSHASLCAWCIECTMCVPYQYIQRLTPVHVLVLYTIPPHITCSLCHCLHSPVAVPKIIISVHTSPFTIPTISLIISPTPPPSLNVPAAVP